MTGALFNKVEVALALVKVMVIRALFVQSLGDKGSV